MCFISLTLFIYRILKNEKYWEPKKHFYMSSHSDTFIHQDVLASGGLAVIPFKWLRASQGNMLEQQLKYFIVWKPNKAPNCFE